VKLLIQGLGHFYRHLSRRSFNWSSRDRRRVIQRTGPLPKL
jgi:hypothetical protein